MSFTDDGDRILPTNATDYDEWLDGEVGEINDYKLEPLEAVNLYGVLSFVLTIVPIFTYSYINTTTSITSHAYWWPAVVFHGINWAPVGILYVIQY